MGTKIAVINIKMQWPINNLLVVGRKHVNPYLSNEHRTRSSWLSVSNRLLYNLSNFNWFVKGVTARCSEDFYFSLVSIHTFATCELKVRKMSKKFLERLCFVYKSQVNNHLLMRSARTWIANKHSHVYLSQKPFLGRISDEATAKDFTYTLFPSERQLLYEELKKTVEQTESTQGQFMRGRGYWWKQIHVLYIHYLWKIVFYTINYEKVSYIIIGDVVLPTTAQLITGTMVNMNDALSNINICHFASVVGKENIIKFLEC